jgi:hypothetical protein
MAIQFIKSWNYQFIANILKCSRVVMYRKKENYDTNNGRKFFNRTQQNGRTILMVANSKEGAEDFK